MHITCKVFFLSSYELLTNFATCLSDRELYEMVNRMANVLKSHGVKKGDVVCIYMPVSPLAVAAMLACARIGAPHRSITIVITVF